MNPASWAIHLGEITSGTCDSGTLGWSRPDRSRSGTGSRSGSTGTRAAASLKRRRDVPVSLVAFDRRRNLRPLTGMSCRLQSRARDRSCGQPCSRPRRRRRVADRVAACRRVVLAGRKHQRGDADQCEADQWVCRHRQDSYAQVEDVAGRGSGAVPLTRALATGISCCPTRNDRRRWRPRRRRAASAAAGRASPA